jgi:hypothetical protein
MTAGDAVVYHDDVVTPAGTVTFSNKTIASNVNTLTIGGTNVNSLIDQDVRSTASPAFAAVVSGTVGPTSSASLSLRTNNSARMVIPAGGIALDNTALRYLAIATDNTTLAYHDDVVTAAGTKTLTNKTIDTASNPFYIGGVAVGNLINQDVRAGANVAFADITCPNYSTLTNTPITFSTNSTLRLQIHGTGIITNSSSLTFAMLTGPYLESRTISSFADPATSGSITINGYTTGVTTTFRSTIINDIVMIRLVAFTGTKSGTGTLTATAAIPAGYRPNSNVFVGPIPWLDGGTASWGGVIVFTNGDMTFYFTQANGLFTGGNTVILNGDANMSWMLS